MKTIFKTTSVFFILFAYFILMAHDVVPHHHHKGLVTFHNTKCTGHKHHEGQPEQEHNHKHDDQVCILKQSVIIPSNSARYGYFFFDFSEDIYSFNCIVFDSSAANSEFLSSIVLPFSPLIKFQYPNIVNNCLGLRAPPII